MEITEEKLKKCRHLDYLATRYAKTIRGDFEDRGDPHVMAGMIESEIEETIESLMPEGETARKIRELEKSNEKLGQRVAELEREKKRGYWG